MIDDYSHQSIIINSGILFYLGIIEFCKNVILLPLQLYAVFIDLFEKFAKLMMDVS